MRIDLMEDFNLFKEELKELVEMMELKETPDTETVKIVKRMIICFNIVISSIQTIDSKESAERKFNRLMESYTEFTDDYIRKQYGDDIYMIWNKNCLVMYDFKKHVLFVSN